MLRDRDRDRDRDWDTRDFLLDDRDFDRDLDRDFDFLACDFREFRDSALFRDRTTVPDFRESS